MSARVRWTVVGGIAVVVALIAVLWLVVLSPRLSEADRLDQQAVDLETANLGLINTYNRTLELVEQAPQAAAEAQRLFAAMPQQADLPTVLEQVTKAATDAGIAPDAIESINTTIPTPIEAGPSTTSSAGGTAAGDTATADPGTADPGTAEQVPAAGASGIALAQLDLSVTARGTQRQALDFLQNLLRLDRVLLVTSSRVLEAPELGAGDQRSIQVTGTMFVLQSELPDLVQRVKDLLRESTPQPALTE